MLRTKEIHSYGDMMRGNCTSSAEKIKEECPEEKLGLTYKWQHERKKKSVLRRRNDVCKGLEARASVIYLPPPERADIARDG